nr:MAG TPA: hypothetical protein [Caudoviricetes sp.]
MTKGDKIEKSFAPSFKNVVQPKLWLHERVNPSIKIFLLLK